MRTFLPAALALLFLCQTAFTTPGSPRAPSATSGAPQSVTQNQRPAPRTPAWYERAYRYIYTLVWPAGRYKGNLSEKNRRNVEKAGSQSVMPRLFLVNVESKTVREWTSAEGVTDFAVDPEGTTLFYLRGREIHQEAIAVQADEVAAGGAAKKIPGVEAFRLYACTRDEGGQLLLWVETTDRLVRPLRLADGAASWVNLPQGEEVAGLDPRVLVDSLRRMRSLRSDGLQAWVRDHKLVGKKDADPRPLLLVRGDGQKAPPEFFGIPAWVKDDSKFLFVNGLLEGE